MNLSVSVIVVNYNGGALLKQCVDALRKQTMNDFEVIVVDNGSSDGSLEMINNGWDKLRILELGKNTGFAVGNNRGVGKARGKWIALLNNDAFPREDWLENLLAATKRYPEHDFFASHQYNAMNPTLLDGTGDMYAYNGIAWRRDYQTPVNKGVNQDDEVFGACAGAAMYRKSCFDEVGGFDEDYFCYFEDVDLSFRLRLAGYHCMHIANAVVYHVGSATAGGGESDFAVYHGYRNFVWTFVKCMPGRLILQYLPSHLLMNARHVNSFMKMGRGKVILKAKWHALIGLPLILSKRKRLKALSRVKQNELTIWMEKRVI